MPTPTDNFLPGERTDSPMSTIGVVLFSSAMQLRYANKLAGEVLAEAGVMRPGGVDRNSFLFKLILLGARVREQWWEQVEDQVEVEAMSEAGVSVRRFYLTGMALQAVDEGAPDFQILILMKADEPLLPPPGEDRRRHHSSSLS